MSDRFRPISTETLVHWVFDELEHTGGIFGIPGPLFYRPREADPYRQTLYGRLLETPFGVAAGPHSQMAQNLIVAWLCGARVMELKTVQTLDELEIPKPCIDMQDEGYNVEWSQELKVHESYQEYLRAWVLIHALHRKLGFPGEAPGVLFNMSVGYDYGGLQTPNMQWYLDKVEDAGEDLARLVEVVAKRFPEVRDLAIPARMCDSVTVSTMHGCPPGEIGDICGYLISQRGLHTSVKLNPTLLGPARVREVLNEVLGFDGVVVPDEAFGHDLKYPDAIPLIRRLQAAADEHGVNFGLKLSNTLEVENHRDVFGDEKMMYLSGRPLHAITANLAARLSEEFDGQLLLSFAGGANAANAPHLLRTGMRTVTTCSDILKSGGYLRLLQYLENTAAGMAQAGARDLDQFMVASARRSDWLPEVRAHQAPPEGADPRACGLYNLKRYADGVLQDRTLMRDTYQRHRSKTPRSLGFFDCVEAPCVDECAVNQKVPQYMALVRERRFDEAVAVTRGDNPLAKVLGRACDHVCEVRCVRTHYDEPLAIREIKRFIIEHERAFEGTAAAAPTRAKVAVIGGGPCGLAAAATLARAGHAATVFEEHPYAGGMVAGTIPVYRTPQPVIEHDLAYLGSLGVEIRCGQRAGRDFTVADLRQQGYQDFVIAIGAQTGLHLGIDGEEGPGVFEGLDFLRRVRHGEAPEVGERVGVVGGGDVAMDCARTALRLGASTVTVIYRRTVSEMPAQKEELDGFLEEGGELCTLVSPKAVLREDGRPTHLVGACMRLGEPDASGRRRPVAIPGEDVRIPLDSLITAIGQRASLDLFGGERPALTRKGYLQVDPETLETSLPGVYAGGDVANGGPESIVKAMGDGQRIAAAILRRHGAPRPAAAAAPEVDVVDLLRRRGRCEPRVEVPHRGADARLDFHEVVDTYPEEAAVAEASRCLDCHVMCSLCTSVCPNLAFMTYLAQPFTPSMPVHEMRGGQLVQVGTSTFAAEQGFQVAVLTDFCNECGNCETFCPTSGTPYRDKPRLYLDREEFLAQDENAFQIQRDGDTWSIEGRFDGRMFQLVDDGVLRYTSPRLHAVLDRDSFELQQARPGDRCREGDRLTLDYCATLFFLLRSLRASLPFLPAAAARAS